MAKAKGTKGKKPAKPAAKKPTAKKPAAKKPAAPAKKPAAKKPAAPEKKPAKVAPKESAKAAPAPPPPAEAAPAAEGVIVKKKKVKRGAPPMLPRRLARRPVPPPHTPGSPPPPPKPTAPGSLHAPARQPEGAESLKARLVKVMNELGKLRALKRNVNKQFFEMGIIITELSNPELYQAKGYGSWESFVEREIERELSIGRVVVEDMRRIVKMFHRAAAEELGFERLQGALRHLFPEQGSSSTPSTRPATA
jgi:hypothetical protein